MTVASRPPAPPYDAVVIGGGPAGAAAAAHLARHDRRVLVAERERFPRFHIGESLIPETNRHLVRIGALEKIAAEGFPVKRGAILLAGDGEHQSYADFSEADGVERTTTWEVPRHRFDQVLLEHAAACGAEVCEGTRAVSVGMEDDAVALTVRSDGAGERVVRARTVIDASGRDGFLAKRLKLRRFDPELRHVGIHAWYEDVEPPPAECAGDVRLISLARGGWAWLIPLDDRRTSVGVVVPRERHVRLPTESPERCLDILLDDIPVVRPFLADRPAGVRGANRGRLLLLHPRVRRRPLAPGRRRGILPRSGLLHRRAAGARRGNRRRRGRPPGSARRQPPAHLRRLRPVPAAGLPVLPPLRDRLLPPGVPRPAAPPRRSPRPVEGGGHRARRQRATRPSRCDCGSSSSSSW